MAFQATTSSAVRPPLVTIFGLYGAGAAEVAHELSRRLRLPSHHQAFSSAALEGGHPELETAEEAAFLHKMIRVLAATFGHGGELDEATAQLKQELIVQNRRSLESCDRTGGVVIGRNAALLLADRPRTLHVLLIGDVANRIARAARETGVSREHAAQRLDREDEVRADMGIALHGWDPRRPEHYDLVVNTSRVPMAGVVDAVMAALAAMPA